MPTIIHQGADKDLIIWTSSGLPFSESGVYKNFFLSNFTLNSPTTDGSSSSSSSLFPRWSLKVWQKSVSPLNWGTSSSSVLYTWIRKKLIKEGRTKPNQNINYSLEATSEDMLPVICHIPFSNKGHTFLHLQLRHRIYSTSQQLPPPTQMKLQLISLLTHIILNLSFDSP